ncbi:MAG: site-specific DNA-methyltransferase [Candidatus Hydrothermia bacterium]|nr:site-specific DNA-methyltransferase [Candidatus Hydrothermia bacterium]
MVKYKVIEIEYPINQKILSYINELFSGFPKEDLFYELNENSLRIYLRKINFITFKRRIFSLLNDETKQVFQEILSKIENIRSYGIVGNKRVYVNYNEERKVKNRKLKERMRNPFFYARDHNFSKKNNPLPDEFKNKIIIGDSEEVLKQLPDNCIDLIFTSPPYNFGLDYSNSEDGINWNSYFDKLFRIFDECIRVLKYGGRIIVNIQPLFSDYIPTHHIISNFFISRKLIWKAEIIWEKNNYNCKYTAWGSWKSPSNPYLKYTWEFLEVFCKGSIKHNGKKELADISADEFKKWTIAKWEIPPEMRMKEFGHPAMFPEELAERVIKLFSFKGDIVLDPFNGVGTTSVVAKKLGRIYVGIDISEEYCRKAIERIEKEERKLF